MIFRMTRIPANFGLEALAQQIARIFELKHEEFEIHSLASDASDETEPQWRTGTASFRVRPKVLQPTGILLEYWPFDLPSASVSSFAKSRLLRHAF